MPNQITEQASSTRLFFITFLFFLSGVTGLVLQVVWMYRLGLVFGNAAYATAATLAAFFLGIALGGRYWGNNSNKYSRPLSIYGLMEIGIAITALLWIPGIEFYKDNYASLLSLLGNNRGALTFAKFIFSVSLLILPTVLMGGTFPILAQYVGKGNSRLASRTTILYALNTLGAACGAFVAGFFLLKEYGVNLTYTIAILLAAGVGAVAFILDLISTKHTKYQNSSQNTKAATSLNKPSDSTKYSILSPSQFILIAFSSGLLALSAETIWTRMFAQVLQNSVYSFSAILVVFLIALGFGGLLAHLLVRKGLPIVPALITLLSLSSILVGFSPIIFSQLTNGLHYLASGSTWVEYISDIFKLTFLVVFVPTVLLGAIFPFLLKASPALNENPGKFVGKLVFYNSLGGTAGPIISGFFLLGLIGLWSTLKIIAILYSTLAIIISLSFLNKKQFKYMAIPALAIIVVIITANPPIVQVNSTQKILNSWQSSDGVLTIIESGGNIEMHLDNYYTLGDSRSILVEQMQGNVPLLIHPNPKKTLFLGMGTGITAGASLNHQVQKVVVVELVSNVIKAAKQYFSPWANNLFKDNRVDIIADDARNYLLGTANSYDVIVGDLFTPWHAGTGSLYTVEHFKQVKGKLATNGIFAQWLPMYQLTPESFEIIAKTFASVFPEVTLWRADFSSTGASIALIGQAQGSKLNQAILEKNISNVVGDNKGADHMVGLFYLGNLKAIESRLSDVRLNTDDRRTVEFQAPISAHQASVGQQTFMVGSTLEDLLSSLSSALPAESDPYLSNLPPNEIRYVKVGLLYFQYQQLVSTKRFNEAESILAQINEIAPDFLNGP